MGCGRPPQPYKLLPHDVFMLWLEPEVQVSELHALTALTSLAALYESQDLDSFEGFIQGVAAITGL
jgi:hypothetical protein